MNQMIAADSKLFKFKSKFTSNTDDNSALYVEVAVPLKFLDNFWRTLDMPLINCEINLTLTWPENCVICKAYGTTILTITDTKLFQLKIIQNYYNI